MTGYEIAVSMTEKVGHPVRVMETKSGYGFIMSCPAAGYMFARKCDGFDLDEAVSAMKKAIAA